MTESASKNNRIYFYKSDTIQFILGGLLVSFIFYWLETWEQRGYLSLIILVILIFEFKTRVYFLLNTNRIITPNLFGKNEQIDISTVDKIHYHITVALGVPSHVQLFFKDKKIVLPTPSIEELIIVFNVIYENANLDNLVITKDAESIEAFKKSKLNTLLPK